MNRKLIPALAALLLGLVAGLALSRPVAAAPTAPVAPDAVAAAESAGLSAETVLNAEAFAEVVDLTEKITPYLYVGEDGLVQIRDASAAEIGVSAEFLADFKAAMGYSNQLIATGKMRVDADMTTTMLDVSAPRPSRGIEPGPRPDGAELALDGAPDAAAPNWGGWDYGQGGMFYSSYNDWTYYRYNYYPLCNSMAAYIRRPWMSTSLCNFWGYNQNYFQNYCYSNYGTYYYMPYQYACQQSYGCNATHKPAYMWTRSYYYQPSCRCYQNNWAWQLFYMRY